MNTNSNPIILDACCGSRMMWFDKKNPATVYADVRRETLECCDGRKLVVDPDIECDFRNLPFSDESFKLVVFDPPHLIRLGKSSWLAQKYGTLLPTWQHDIKQGFNECMRVLQFHGVLIFKWNEAQIKLTEILKAIDCEPLFGHTSGKNGFTHWLAFMKGVSQ